MLLLLKKFIYTYAESELKKNVYGEAEVFKNTFSISCLFYQSLTIQTS